MIHCADFACLGVLRPPTSRFADGLKIIFILRALWLVILLVSVSLPGGAGVWSQATVSEFSASGPVSSTRMCIFKVLTFVLTSKVVENQMLHGCKSSGLA